MWAQRLMRHLPGRSQLMIIVGVAIAILVFVIFVDVALDKNATFARLQRAQAKVDLLEEQNARLEREVLRFQNGQGLGPKAWEYFGWTLPHVGVIIGVPAEAQPAAAQP